MHTEFQQLTATKEDVKEKASIKNMPELISIFLANDRL